MNGQGLGVATFVIPIGVIVLAIVAIIFIRMLIKQYNRVAPNSVAVVFGKKHGDKGYRVVTGGGFFLMPVVEEVKYLSLNIMSIDVAVQNAPDQNGVLLSVKGVANIKIRSQAEHLPAAIERFLGKSEEEIKKIAKDNLEGNLRALTGTLTVEELIRDRTKFQAQVLGQVGADMAKLGLDIDLLNIQDIRDDKGYIESLGRKQTAEVLRNAQIGEAEAQRETSIKTSVAKREGEVAQAEAAQQISNAERERDTVKATNAAQVQAQQARIEIVAQAAAAEEQKNLNVALVEADKAKVEAEINLQDAIQRRNVAEQNATTIVDAQKKGEAKIIAARAEQDSAMLQGEALRIKSAKEGEGEQAKLTALSVGRKAAASATQAEAEAQAAGEKAGLLARADGRKAELLAEADGVRARLLAEAEGVEKKAEAFAKLDQAGRFLMLMEALPPVIQAFGQHVVAPAAASIGEGLSNIEELRIVDLGGASNNGNGVLSNFMKTPVLTLNQILEQVRASGQVPALAGLLSKAGIDITSLMKSVGVETPATPEAVPASIEDGGKVEE